MVYRQLNTPQQFSSIKSTITHGGGTDAHAADARAYHDAQQFNQAMDENNAALNVPENVAALEAAIAAAEAAIAAAAAEEKDEKPWMLIPDDIADAQSPDAARVAATNARTAATNTRTTAKIATEIVISIYNIFLIIQQENEQVFEKKNIAIAAAAESEQIYNNDPTNINAKDEHIQRVMEAVAAEDTAIYAEKINAIMNEQLMNAADIERNAKTLANELEKIANDKEEAADDAPNTATILKHWKNSTGGKTNKKTHKRKTNKKKRGKL